MRCSVTSRPPTNAYKLQGAPARAPARAPTAAGFLLLKKVRKTDPKTVLKHFGYRQDNTGG